MPAISSFSVHAGLSPTSLTTAPSRTLPTQPHVFPITSPHFSGTLTVRTKSTPTSSPAAPPDPYFANSRRLFSVQLSGKFAQDWCGDDLVFGIALEREVALPWGSDLAIKVAKVIDPGLSVHLRGAKPSAFSPMLCSMNVLNIVENTPPSTPTPTSIATPAEDHARQTLSPPSYFNKTRLSRDSAVDLDSSGGLVEERNLMMVKGKDMSAGDRRTHFLNQSNRQNFTFSASNTYTFDFYNRYFDPATARICLPGLAIDANRYLNGQPLRFVAKARNSDTVFFVVEFHSDAL